MRQPVAVNYIAGPFVLLHISVRSHGQLVVLNDRIGPSWREQIELHLAPQSLVDTLEIEVFFGSTVVSVRAGDHPPVEVTRGLDIGEAEQIEFSDHIQFHTFSPPPPPPPTLRLTADLPSAGAKSEQFLGEIRVADIQHVAGWIEISPEIEDAQPRALLLALVNGPELARYPFESLASGKSQRSNFVAELRLDSRLADGTDIQLLVETTGGRAAVARATVASAIIGGIDRVTPRLVGGWAWNIHLKHEAVPVEILINGKVAGTAVANRSRPDLGEIDPALDRSGFLFRIPSQLDTQDVSDLSVSVRVAQTRIMLANGQWPLARRITLAHAMKQA
jgi:hypothetical protein